LVNVDPWKIGVVTQDLCGKGYSYGQKEGRFKGWQEVGKVVASEEDCFRRIRWGKIAPQCGEEKVSRHKESGRDEEGDHDGCGFDQPDVMSYSAGFGASVSGGHKVDGNISIGTWLG